MPELAFENTTQAIKDQKQTPEGKVLIRQLQCLHVLRFPVQFDGNYSSQKYLDHVHKSI